MDGERSQANRFMRFLGLLLGGLMLVNFVAASVVYGDAPAYLLLGGGALVGWLFLTSGLWQRWGR